MRSRNIKPGFFINEDLLQLKYEERILFIGLWCIADREGYFEYKPTKIKVQIFPDDKKVDIKKMICNLMSLHLITCNDTYCYIPKFTAHHRPHPHEAKSTVPDEIRKAFKNNVIKCNDMSCNVTKCQADIRNEDVMNKDIRNKNSLPENNSGYSLEFENLWKIYPNHNEKKAAFIEYKKLKVDADLNTKMLEAVRRQIDYKSECDAKKVFCPEFLYLSRWLKRHRWEDELPSAPGKNLQRDEDLKEARKKYEHLIDA